MKPESGKTLEMIAGIEATLVKKHGRNLRMHGMLMRGA